MTDTSLSERERDLLDVLPARYFDLEAADAGGFFGYRPALKRFERGFRIVFELSDEDIKCKVAARFVQVLREEDGTRVDSYRNAFFVPADLKFASEPHRPMVKQHLLVSVGSFVSGEQAALMGDLAPFLSPPSEVRGWVGPGSPK